MSLRSLTFCDSDDLTESPWNDTFSFLWLIAAHHCVSLSAAGLPIRENSSIVSIQHAVDKRKGTLFVDQTLSWVRRKYKIEGETFRLLLIILSNKIDLIIFGVDFHNIDAVYMLQK